MLARGLVKDRSAIEELTGIVVRSGDPTLRGFSCVALGLIQDAREEVKDALKLALHERKSVDLRRDAATGLGLLRDADACTLLLDELKRAKSFAVQGQLITAIGTIGDQTAIDPLVQLLDDRSQTTQTRAMAAVGLGMIGDLRKIPPLSRLSKNYNYRASVSDLDELLFIL
jgi:HEAT repeat protein